MQQKKSTTGKSILNDCAKFYNIHVLQPTFRVLAPMAEADGIKYSIIWLAVVIQK